MSDVIEVPFGEWLPDLPKRGNPGLTVAENVIPKANGYEPFRTSRAMDVTVTGNVQGAAEFFDQLGNSVIVGGTDDTLFHIEAGTATETSVTSVGTACWDFCRYGDYIIATADGSVPQYLDDIDTDTSWSNLPGTPGAAATCAKIGDFVMLGNLTQGGNAIRWSAFNDPTASWAASRLTQAGVAFLPRFMGDVKKIVGGRVGMVFQERGIHRLSYVGPPTVWRADPISEKIGAVSQHSVVTRGYNTYFLADDGFYVTNGSSVEPISTVRINEWFFQNLDHDLIWRVAGAIDRKNECIVWAFNSNSTGNFDKLVVFSYAVNRWSYVDLGTGATALHWPLLAKSDGLTLEELSTLYPDLEDVPVSLDSPRWRAQYSQLCGFNKYGLVTFDSTPMEARFVTAEMQPRAGQSAHVSEVRPLMEADNWDARALLLMRDNMGQERSSLEMPMGFYGFCPIEGEGKTMRVQLVKPTGSEWSDATGVQVRVAAAGMH